MIEAALSGTIAAAVSAVGALFAAKAAKNSKPVANGFTSEVLKELRYLRSRIDTHIDTHHT